MSPEQIIDFNNKTILVTGSPGFIGAHLVMRLLREMSGGTIISFDNMNTYYDPALKEYRLAEIEKIAAEQNQSDRQTTDHVFVHADLSDKAALDDVFEKWKPDIVVHLAAQAGVRYSIENPDAYIMSNIVGFFNILEACRRHPVMHLVYASSSSVYGNCHAIPFSTDAKTDEPVSLYAATKKSDELLASSYSSLYGIPSTGLRFFTVYGPAGRPDMFYYSATEDLIKGKSIRLFNYGNCSRDYTYVNDIVEGIIRVIQKPSAHHAVYNIGAGSPVNLTEFIGILQEELVNTGLLPPDYDFEAHIELVPMQPGDVEITYADTSSLEETFGYHPTTEMRDGIRCFIEWYDKYRHQS